MLGNFIQTYDEIQQKEIKRKQKNPECRGKKKNKQANKQTNKPTSNQRSHLTLFL